MSRVVAERITVAGLAATPVKGLRIGARTALRLEHGYIAGDRLFYLVDGRGRLVNGKRAAGLQVLTADYDEARRHLAIGFPGGERVDAPVQARRERADALLLQRARGPAGEGPLRAGASPSTSASKCACVAPTEGAAADRGVAGAVSIVSRASLALLARVAGESAVDVRRFRMSMELAGAAAHEEDEWVGSQLSIGEARVAIEGHVGRCIVTTRNPESDVVDLPTLDLLRS